MNIKINKTFPALLAGLSVLFFSARLSAQKLYELNEPYRTILNSGRFVNSYYMGNNPAFLSQEISDEFLSIKSTFNNQKGEFRRFIDPPDDRLYQISATGKKSLENNQIFKGSFGFRRVERGSWPWLATRSYEINNPYLMGDSTSGRTHYNGIAMNAAYSASLTDRVLLGFSIDYGVDEGLKEVSPRPTSRHRDISLSLGAGYRFSDRLTLGLSAGMFDNNERISYSEDEGAIYNDVIILKFRGYDFPYAVKKKVETRHSYHNGISAGADLSFRISAEADAAAFFKAGIEKLTVKDDPTDPKSSGFWKNYRYDAGALSCIKLSKSWQLGFFYNFGLNDMWARHPDYTVLMMEGKSQNHTFLAGLTRNINTWLSAGAEAGVEINGNDYKDYFSRIFWKSDGLSYLLTLAADMVYNDNLNMTLSYGFRSYKGDNSQNISGTHSAYFMLYRYKDIAYYQTDFTRHTVDAKIGMKLRKFGLVNLYLDYNTSRAGGNPVFTGSSRNNFSSTLEFRLNVY